MLNTSNTQLTTHIFSSQSAWWCCQLSWALRFFFVLPFVYSSACALCDWFWLLWSNYLDLCSSECGFWNGSSIVSCFIETVARALSQACADLGFRICRLLPDAHGLHIHIWKAVFIKAMLESFADEKTIFTDWEKVRAGHLLGGRGRENEEEEMTPPLTLRIAEPGLVPHAFNPKVLWGLQGEFQGYQATQRNPVLKNQTTNPQNVCVNDINPLSQNIQNVKRRAVAIIVCKMACKWTLLKSPRLADVFFPFNILGNRDQWD